MPDIKEHFLRNRGIFQLNYNLSYNLLVRLTNQLHDMGRLKKEVFEQMNVEYTAVMRRFSSQGWVSNWDHSAPSVWLTSYVIRILEAASFQVSSSCSWRA